MSDVPETTDPERLLDTADPTLRALLRAGREEVPDEAQLAVLVAKLGPIVGGGGGGGGAAGGAATKAAIAKGVASATIAKVVGTVATVAILGVATARMVGTPRATVSTNATSTSTSTLPPTPTPTATATVTATESSTPTAALPSPTPPPDETKLLGRAQSDLLTDPARALTECTQLAKQFPHGDLVQEREVIAIDALARLGRRDEANARASRFAEAYPQSAYRRRIDAILER
jgi:hypothetical protein